jgi:predicted ester cyclase
MMKRAVSKKPISLKTLGKKTASKKPKPANLETKPVFDFADHPDIQVFADAANTGRRQPMNGFDADYVDIVDYIVRCTHKIWEEKAIGLIYTHYGHNAIVHSSNGVVYGREAVVRNTLQSQAMTPNLRAYADDVIWGGNERDGFYSSHRVLDTSTHSGYSDIGAPTGRKFQRWVIADCFILENKIVEEWLAYDATAGLRQVGLDPFELARQSTLEVAPSTLGELDRGSGQYAPEFHDVPSSDDPQAFIRAVLHNLWNARLVNMVRAHYAPGLVSFVPGGQKLYGFGDLENFVITLMASFPDLAFNIDHQCVVGSEARGYRVATRFTIQGTHEGFGPYGLPTGRRVFLIGMYHQVIRDGKIAQEWLVFDEFALLKQLHARIGVSGGG